MIKSFLIMYLCLDVGLQSALRHVTYGFERHLAHFNNFLRCLIICSFLNDVNYEIIYVVIFV